MVLFGQNDFIRQNVVVFDQKWLYSGKVVVFEQSGCFGKSGCIRSKVVVFG